MEPGHRDGWPVPWKWVRRVVAQRWGIPPPDVDEYPNYEIEDELRLMQIEAECAR